MTQVISIESLKMASKVIGTDSWLEDTLERKRKRNDESVSTKEIVSLTNHSRTTLTKVKKKKTLLILGQDPEIGHLTMEIAKPKKVGESRI